MLDSRVVRIRIEGMHCADCEAHVRRALEGAGARVRSVRFRRGEAIAAVPAAVAEAALRAAVARAGYRVVEVAETGPEPGARAAAAGRGAGALPAAMPERRGPASERVYDLAIIGSGGAAFAAAIRASEAGADVVMLERGTVGGTCVNVGCVPSKTLLRAAEIHHLAGHHAFAGLATAAAPVRLGPLMAQKDELVRDLRREKYEDLISQYGWELVRGEAAFADARTLEVDGRRLRAEAFVIATGARPAVPDLPGLREAGFLTSTDVLALDHVPESVAVIGSGYVALELGQWLARLGARVTLMQRGPRLLKGYDPEIGEAMRQVLADEGIELLTGVRYLRVESGHDGRRLRLEVAGSPRAVEAAEILVAAGRRPNTEALRLERAGLAVGPRGEVPVDAELRTAVPHILAAGDVTAGPQFVYVAAYEGGLAADNGLGAHRRVDLDIVPSVTFTSPSLASVGLTEERARSAGYDVKASVLPLSAVPRALVNRDTRGVIKLVADAASGRLLGAHAVAEQAGEVVGAATLAVRFRLSAADLTETLLPYLTMAEGLKLAALGFTRDVHRLSCCAG